MPQSRRLGSDAEDHAADYLLSLGWTLVARRQKMPSGELDLIAFDGPTLVFVEVKRRKRGDAIESLTALKRKRLVASAEEYVASQALGLDLVWRFDAVVFDGDEMRHYRSLFED